ncbi:MAG: LptF/LptG family permease [Myxococcota bacterium]
MSTLDRYLLREIAIPLLVGLGLFVVVLVFAQLLAISDAITGLGISGPDLLRALAYSLPPLLGLLLPVSLLFATLLAIGRWSGDRELTALAAGGVSPYLLLRVPVAMALLLGAISAVSMGWGEAWGIRGLRNLMSKSAQRALASGVRPGEFHEWLPGVTFLAEETVDGKMKGVVFADLRDKDRPLVVSARSGTVKVGERARDIVFDLEDGSLVVRDDENESRRVVRFETSLYRLDVDRLVANKGKSLSRVQEKSLSELARDAREDPDPARRAQYTVVMHRRFAIPMATLIFAVLAVPLAVGSSGAARARGFLVSAGLVGGYYYVGRVAELAARAGNFDAVLAAWLPNLIGVVMAVVLLVRFRKTAR